jgi:taspase (threonine aspartase 1)
MQHLNFFHPKNISSSKTSNTRDRIRQIRRSIFRKTQKPDLEIVSSPFIDTHIEWMRRSHDSEADLELLDLIETHSITSSNHIMDGATERMFRRSQMSQSRQPQVSAIFVHAGAGYHSTTNEHMHLGACDKYV